MMEHPILQKIQAGQLKPQVREQLILGKVPLDFELLVPAFYLVLTQSPELQETARETVQEWPEGPLSDILSREDLPSGMVDYFLTTFVLPQRVLSALLLNPLCSGQAVALAAMKLSGDALDLAINNQVKILEFPPLVEALLANPTLSINQRAKLEEYGHLLLNVVSPERELQGLSAQEIEQRAIEEARVIVAREGVERVQRGDLVASGGGEDEGGSIYKLVALMGVPQKVQAAIKGNREMRNLLVRDSNKLVCSAVIKSPRITEAEIEFYASLRNIQGEVLRMIAMNREWQKNYKIIHNLVKNPRTPVGLSVKLVARLSVKDIRLLKMDRGVPEVVRTTAKRFLAAKKG